ncbi:hypothetical protein GLOIN_2v1486903 [Rhizophagus clarus]|uniref:Uncharacterized protein n=1 Tax=Rhizophagus clarus TaxID=94130 RepID=A0A8H3QUB1_9GLOM|nr:hypothetical protein GLOIN_2v1486903 [Rhizophagus clarus]
MDKIDKNDSSDIDSDLEETHIELPNVNKKKHASTKDHTDATNLGIARAEFIKVSNNSVDTLKIINDWKKLDKAIAFGITMINESTDISCKPYLVIYVKYCLIELFKYNGKDNFNIGAHQLLTWNENYGAGLIVDISSFASAVISEIQERIPDRPLLNPIKYLIMQTSQTNSKEELIKYDGNEELNILSESYKKEVSNIYEEWNYYSIPFSSVDWKRGFSKQNLIKTDLRNSLNNATLHFWMMVNLEEKDLSEFCFYQSITNLE